MKYLQILLLCISSIFIECASATTTCSSDKFYCDNIGCCTKQTQFCQKNEGGAIAGCFACNAGETGCNTTCCKSTEYCADFEKGQCKSCASGQFPCGYSCCKEGYACINNECSMCPANRTACVLQCCLEEQACVNGVCTTCTSGAACGEKCCVQGEHCSEGICKKCALSQIACGDKCCGESTQICTENNTCKTCTEGPACFKECCSSGEICKDGKCQIASCPSGQEACLKVCCPTGQACKNGKCKAVSCPSGQVYYGGECRCLKPTTCPKGSTCCAKDGCCSTGCVLGNCQKA